MKLHKLLQGLEYILLGAGSLSFDIKHISDDSREVGGGSLFVAISGDDLDGHNYIDNAINNGCLGVVVNEKFDISKYDKKNQVLFIVVRDTRKACGVIARNYFNNPAAKLKLIAITGTNGKTTVSYLVESLLSKVKSVGVIGTINYRYLDKTGEQIRKNSLLTTPGSLVLQKILKKMVDAGVEVVIMEVSSHALVQQRLGSLLFDVAVFTNLSRDHLDYHNTMEEYFSAKARLFSHHLKKDGVAVLTNGDNDSDHKWIQRLKIICEEKKQPVIQCGLSSNNDIYPRQIEGDLYNTKLTLDVCGKEIQVDSPLVGDFNILNLLTAASVAESLGMSSIINQGLSNSCGAPGRLERVSGVVEAMYPQVFVDYAHTPKGLKSVLSTLTPYVKGKIITVFGCGGNRDQGKRELMGMIAAKYSDVVILTDDNPRYEKGDFITSQIENGVKDEGMEIYEQSWLNSRKEEGGCVVINDRSLAISKAIGCASADDIVIIAGKGHEDYQLKQGERYYFDDKVEVEKILTSWTIDTLQLATDGQCVGEKRKHVLGRVITDSREVTDNDIYIALRGEKFDGHDFVLDAFRKGAKCAIVEDEQEVEQDGVTQLVVDNSFKALGDLAAYRRAVMKKFNNPIIAGITGSCGKTTVKDMTASIMKHKWCGIYDDEPKQVLKTKGNFNNLIGVPLSLLPISRDHRAVIIEMGMNMFGEIGRLAEITDPDVACILNINEAHLEGLGSVEGVARAKGEIWDNSRSDTIFIVNADDPLVCRRAEKYKQKKIFFSTRLKCNNVDIWSSDVNMTAKSNNFCLHIGKESSVVKLNIIGKHNVSNALAAAAIAYAAKISMKDIVAGLESFTPSDKRMEIVNGRWGLKILNDTYNANPASMKAGLQSVKQCAACSMAVLGDMLELGENSKTAHFDLGKNVVKSNINYLALFGVFSEETRNGAIANGMSKKNIRIFQDKEEIVTWVMELIKNNILSAGDCVFVKGSRSMQLETVVEQLKLSTS